MLKSLGFTQTMLNLFTFPGERTKTCLQHPECHLISAALIIVYYVTKEGKATGRCFKHPKKKKKEIASQSTSPKCCFSPRSLSSITGTLAPCENVPLARVLLLCEYLLWTQRRLCSLSCKMEKRCQSSLEAGAPALQRAEPAAQSSGFLVLFLNEYHVASFQIWQKCCLDREMQ